MLIEGKTNMKNIDAIRAEIKAKILVSYDGDYILQALLLKGMYPNGW